MGSYTHTVHRNREQISGCRGRGWRVGSVKWVKGVRRYKLPVIKKISPRNVMHSMATTADNTVLRV